MKLAELNALDHAGFVRVLGWIFEDAPWVAERSWPFGPFERLDDLHRTMVDQVATATSDEQLALLRSHPDLGSRITMSAASRSEQSGAGLTSLDQGRLDELRRLNAAYRTKFGFPFLFAVKGSTSDEILSALRHRIERPADVELAEALTQVYRIARFRLEDTIS